MKARTFGLTGGIASGKSTVTRLFRDEGVHMVDADEVARELVAPGMPVLKLLVAAFGREILHLDGSLNRPKLGSIVFTDLRKRGVLDQIMHQHLLDEIRSQMRKAQAKNSLVGLDAALLVEKGLHVEFRPLVVVAASSGTQLQRLMERDGFTEAEARARIGSQIPLDEKTKLADYVIQNDGNLDELIQRALGVLARLRCLPPTSG